ncbi:hypothetical protein OUZ56_013097 [Daphnia magna]|uniref:Uncharacterized protein n=1 Tax=Daphnia magna TaxID=35525 RepID=A0ABQ9Z4W3_9CRUS|nr:hypothetical protein OUZ56_013097 [Daphnia magna]
MQRKTMPDCLHVEPTGLTATVAAHTQQDILDLALGPCRGKRCVTYPPDYRSITGSSIDKRIVKELTYEYERHLFTKSYTIKL